MANSVEKTEQEWKRVLSPERFHVVREQGTEPAFTGEYYDTKEEGVYQCAACGTALFPSDTKFESGTGWPSFWAPITEENIATETDRTHGMVRTEVLCNTCHSHLGHLFNDGPEPTGLRYSSIQWHSSWSSRNDLEKCGAYLDDLFPDSHRR